MSVFGWLWEVGMHLVSYGEFVNRGALHGPWLPIYGTGAVLILTVLNRFRKNPALEFGATIVLMRFSGVYDFTCHGDCHRRYEMVGLQRILS